MARGNLKIVERVDEREPLLFSKLEGMFVGFVVDFAGQHHFSTMRFRALDLDVGRGGGHDDGGGYAELLGGIGNALGVVACGSRDQSAFALLIGKR